MKHPVKIIVISSTVLLISGLLSIRFGAVNYSLETIIHIFTGQGTDIQNTIMFSLRVPRTVVLILTGATLGISGTIIKIIMKNPLADPGLLGVQTGAASVAIIILLILPNYIFLLPMGAFIGGIIAYLLVMLLAYNKTLDPIKMILAGVAVNALFGAFIAAMTVFYSDAIQGVLIWMNGSFADVSVLDMQFVLIYSVIGIVLAFSVTRFANIMRLNDQMIHQLGIKVSVVRFLLASISVLLATISVAYVGIISFIALITPHIAKLLVGSNYKYWMPLSMVLGSVVLVLSDVIQRVIFNPLEIPVGIITAIIGAPFFLYLLRRTLHHDSIQ
jgi:iron complex transport system permease protein